MGKLLGIDLGSRRTGIAITDDLQIIASPLETVDSRNILDYLDELFATEKIDLVVMGEPRHRDGQPMEMTDRVHQFKQVLEKRYPGIPVELEDERFTSKMARASLLASGIKKKQRRDKSLLDKISASLILQSYLERRNL
jgi:putative Holliday junction resolvase